ncbi:uncharacterized protein LOC116349194 [Contarinia nasturtii]|uniref:uncharacterized protein LOC116349194 n=1 Tax=Contarinia nasturtii TaxID=265458 RepID=UPI0012D3C05B|nr:uncharacterized protein LOC116349194 [Contarinia nasturtii]
MDRIVNVRSVTTILMAVFIVVVHNVHCIESTAFHSGSITNSIRNSSENVPNEMGTAKLLSRRKRYVAFPEGSSFSVAFCATIGMIGNPELDYMSWALNWGLAYDLPNETWVIQHRHEKYPKPLVQRRHRRDLYNRLEVAIDNMGYNGRECILRALCESAQYFFGKGTNMVEELIRIVFTLPDTKVLSFEHNDLHDYDRAHRMGKNNVYCSSAFRDCSISLIELALGRYAKPYNFM